MKLYMINTLVEAESPELAIEIAIERESAGWVTEYTCPNCGSELVSDFYENSYGIVYPCYRCNKCEFYLTNYEQYYDIPF